MSFATLMSDTKSSSSCHASGRRTMSLLLQCPRCEVHSCGVSSLRVYVLTEIAVDLDLHTGIRLIPQLELDAAAARSDGLADLRALGKLSSDHKEPIITLQCRTSYRSAHQDA